MRSCCRYSRPTTAQEITEPGAPCQPRLPEDKGDTFDKLNPLVTRRAPTATRTPRVTATATETATPCVPTPTRRPALFNPPVSLTPPITISPTATNNTFQGGVNNSAADVNLNSALHWPAFVTGDFSGGNLNIERLSAFATPRYDEIAQGVELTRNVADQSGSMWLTGSYNVKDGFEALFSFCITAPGGTNVNGGDGLAFVVRYPNSAFNTGRIGCDLGYAGISGAAVEFDTFRNFSGTSCTNYDDPDENHISLQTSYTRNLDQPIDANGAGRIGTAVSLNPYGINLKDGRTHSVRITYNPPDPGTPTGPSQPFTDVCSPDQGQSFAMQGLLCVYVDDMNVPKMKRQITINPAYAYLGFTAGTGSSYARHTILSWHIATRRYPIHTIGMYYPRDSTFYLRNSNTQGPADNAFYFGPADYGCSPLAGNWNGDGVDTVGLFCDYNARFYLRDTNNQGFADYAFAWGNPGDTPFAGRWAAGAVKDGVALFRPSNGILYLDNDLNGGVPDKLAVLGSPSDLPVVGKWAGDAELDSFGVYHPGLPGYNANDFDFGSPSLNVDLYRDFPLTGTPFNVGQAYRISIGQPTSIPLMGDWGGLGSEGMAVVVGGNYIRQIDMLRSGPTNRNFYYGDPSFRPLAGSWLSTPRATALPTNTPTPPAVCSLRFMMVGSITPSLYSRPIAAAAYRITLLDIGVPISAYNKVADATTPYMVSLERLMILRLGYALTFGGRGVGRVLRTQTQRRILLSHRARHA